MNQEIFEWLLLLGRWLHITVAVTWIGTSIFFMWLDRTIEFNELNKQSGHVGELWMVHGGGFYHVEKMLMGPTQVPESLHWFKWESYWTWLSGIFLLTLIFYAGSGTFLLDSAISHITYWQAVGLSLASIVVSWLFYDFLWESKLTKSRPEIGHLLTLIWFGGMSYLLCHTLSGRAAYMHVGGMLGTWMTANVFLRIIPRQVKMVEASKRGEAVNQEWAKNAKNRSTHNTYFTLPVIFIMLSNHFPSTYGHTWNWLILILMSAAGAAIREFFIVRLKNPARSKTFAAVGALLLVAAFWVTQSGQNGTQATDSRGQDLSQGGQTVAPVPAAIVSGAVIEGTVSFQGDVPKAEKLQVPLICNPGSGDVFSNDILIRDGKIKNVLVRIAKGLEGQTFSAVPTDAVVLDQKNCQYQPRVAVARVGQNVEFVNSDATFHNVRSFTTHNESFNLAMPNRDDRVTRVFNQPEIFVQTKCSVHPWMNAYLAILDHPYFSVTDASGRFEISGLKPGRYTLEIWHEVFGTQTREIMVSENSRQTVDFVMEKR